MHRARSVARPRWSSQSGAGAFSRMTRPTGPGGAKGSSLTWYARLPRERPMVAVSPPERGLSCTERLLARIDGRGVGVHLELFRPWTGRGTQRGNPHAKETSGWGWTRMNRRRRVSRARAVPAGDAACRASGTARPFGGDAEVAPGGRPLRPQGAPTSRHRGACRYGGTRYSQPNGPARATLCAGLSGQALQCLRASIAQGPPWLIISLPWCKGEGGGIRQSAQEITFFGPPARGRGGRPLFRGEV